jgi:Glycosyl transferase family 2
MPADQSNSQAMNARPLLSIIIPTRNRSKYLISTIRSILRWKSDDFELVVHDNGDTPAVRDVIAIEFSDCRLRYYYTPTELSFCQTFERAVGLSVGEYVCIIGDDDGITSEAIEVIRWAQANNVDSITPLARAIYGWPDFRLRYYKDSDAARLQIRPFTGQITFINVEHELIQSARSAFQDFCALPKLYGGFVRRACLESLACDTGAIFFGCSPDLSSAVALTKYATRHCTLDYPIVISGSSCASGAGKSMMKEHVGTLETTPQTGAFAAAWPQVVPRFYAVQTVWAQAALEGLHAIRRPEVLYYFDVALLHAACLQYNPAYLRAVLRSLPGALQAAGQRQVAGHLRFAVGLAATAGARLQSHLSRALGIGYFRSERVFCEVPDIDSAVHHLTKYLAATGRTFATMAKRHPTPALGPACTEAVRL